MPRLTRISPDLLAEFAKRRAQGEPAKVIARDMARRGFPADRSSWHRACVAQRRETCAAAEQDPTPPA